jgi:hypothetical protein
MGLNSKAQRVLAALPYLSVQCRASRSVQGKGLGCGAANNQRGELTRLGAHFATGVQQGCAPKVERRPVRRFSHVGDPHTYPAV